MATLNDLIQELELQAEVFFSGGLCGLQAFTESETAGHLHLLRSGAMTLYTDQGHKAAYGDAHGIVYTRWGTP